MKKLIILLGSAAALLFALWSSAQSADFKIIVHPDNPATSLSAKDVSNFLLKKKSRWTGDGFRESVEPVDLDGNSATREAFSRAVHGRSVSSIKNYWQRQIFSGRGVPPPEVASDADVIAHVQSRPGAIGYVSANASLSGVKEVTLAN